MRKLFIALTALTIGIQAVAQEKPTTDSYQVAFDRTTARTRTDRMLTTLALDNQIISVTQPMLMYNDLTDQCFKVNPGQKVVPVFGYSGQWMQGSIYIDLNRNGRFDVRKPMATGTPGGRNELLCFAGLELANGKYNSARQKLDNLAGVQPPAFTIPDSLKTGYYMMRWVVDWNSYDPAGSMVSGNDIITNGGAIADVLLYVTDEEITDDYELIFSDEFDQPDGSRPDPTKWTASTRYSATWNRWISDSPEVAYIKDGSLVCLAIPNPDRSKDNAAMLTGAMETRNKFNFTYGKVEVRLRTNLHTGNFPAAWMMPQPPCEGWPNAGEIDIFESIDGENVSYHTVHSNWTYNLGNRGNPQSSFSKSTTVNQWHVYGLIWTETMLMWTIDGVPVGTYPRSSDASAIAKGQWPFDHPFYIILNQSVGNGSWAKNADTNYIYKTEFDWVRVYQLKPDAVRDITLPDTQPQASNYTGFYDLSGREVASPSQAFSRKLSRGIYISGGKKVFVE